MNRHNAHKTAIAHVLVIEDDPDLREAMVDYLNTEDLIADGVGSLAGAQTWQRTHAFDVVILDLGLPDGDGLTWLQQMPQLESKGVIIMTARGTAEQRIAGMRAGADAYLVKPVSLEELALHVKNLFRRLVESSPQRRAWQLQKRRWLLITPEGKDIPLSHSETRLLAALAQGNGDAVLKAELIRALGFDPQTYDDRRLEALVRRLRQKCHELMGEHIPLQTVYGQGYAFTETLEMLAG